MGALDHLAQNPHEVPIAGYDYEALHGATDVVIR